MLKKHRQHKDNILFIDASQHFGKATNQNYLRDEDLARILEAVDKRDQLAPEKADKFAYVASIKEIAEDNDYNLNIPRYVDTFEEEDLVSLEEVGSELELLNKTIKEIDAKIFSYCDELGVNFPRWIIFLKYHD